MKLMEKEFRKALRDDGDIVGVLVESYGSKELARIHMAYLAIHLGYSRTWWKVVKWIYFSAGVAVTLVLGLLVKVFS